MFKRSSGVLAHVTSLPSPHGVGTMGKTARDFVDFSGGGAPDLLAGASARSYRLRRFAVPVLFRQRQAIRI